MFLKILKNYYPLIIILVLISLSITSFLKPGEPTESFIPERKENRKVEVTFIYVDLKGQIKHPGVYKVEEHLRLFQVINLAGGLTSDAYLRNINLSAALHDQQVIYIPTENDVKQSDDSSSDLIESNKININTADVELLDTLPGIGRVIAEDIIAYRLKNGNYESIEDIMNVSGIGDVTFEKIKNLIYT
ncbi:MAG: ComEA family DNA-binding protein [Candidatus Izimaplasma sp.]|nr:ComEA family DNA-binding protein [Candidatus Izimaplasma bacterium]